MLDWKKLGRKNDQGRERVHRSTFFLKGIRILGEEPYSK